MTMTDERLAELDAAVAHDTRGVMTLLYKNWPDLRAHIDAQAATIAGLRALTLDEDGIADAIGESMDAEMSEPNPHTETLEQFAERIAKQVRKQFMDQLDDHLIGTFGQSHIVFGKACAMKAIEVAMSEAKSKGYIKNHEPNEHGAGK